MTEPLAVLKTEVARHISQAAAARALGITPQFLNKMLKQDRPVPDEFAEKCLGLRKKWVKK